MVRLAGLFSRPQGQVETTPAPGETAVQQEAPTLEETPTPPEPEVPRQAEVIAFANQKGGVAKTTSTLNLAVALSEDGHRVLVVDMDPQGNLTMSQGLNPDQITRSMFDVLVHRLPIDQVIQQAEVDLAVSSIDLAGAELALSSMIGRERALEKALNPIKERYDFILIDTPPSLGLLTINALVASNGVRPISPFVPWPSTRAAEGDSNTVTPSGSWIVMTSVRFWINGRSSAARVGPAAGRRSSSCTCAGTAAWRCTIRPWRWNCSGPSGPWRTARTIARMPRPTSINATNSSNTAETAGGICVRSTTSAAPTTTNVNV